MTNETAQGILEFLLPQMQQEYAITCNVLAAVPADTCQYKPSEKCMSGLELASHIALSQAFFLSGVIEGKLDWKQQEFATPAAVLAWYQETLPPLLAQAATLPAEKLAQPIAFHTWNDPAVAYLGLDLKHTIHHRGQLSSYLRPMGSKVPAIYGGSADTVEAAA